LAPSPRPAEDFPAFTNFLPYEALSSVSTAVIKGATQAGQSNSSQEPSFSDVGFAGGSYSVIC
jgi:hypothetical protein